MGGGGGVADRVAAVSLIFAVKSLRLLPSTCDFGLLPIHMARFGLFFLLAACKAFTLPSLPRSRAVTVGIRCLGVTLQEKQSPASEAKPAARAVSSEQVDLVERASDPFGIIRVVLYVTFGISGIAGIGIAASQMGEDPGKAMSNLAVNAAVLAGGVGIFLFDRSVTAKLREKADQELKNPYLKGDAVLKPKDDDE